MLFTCFGVSAQIRKGADSASKMSKIHILDNDMGEYIKNDTNSVNKLIGNVKLLHGSDTLYCDSAYFYSERNGVEAFGDVIIRQADGTEASADYMRYNGMTKVVFMKADKPNREVQLYDGKVNTLWSKEIDYNMSTKIGKYRKRGQLQTETTILESNTGEYNMKTKDARFRGDVVVNDPEYRAVSSDLGYNTDTKVARFFGPSVVTNDKSILQTSNGVYDTKNRTSHFVSRSSILNEAQYIEADTLDYDRNSGFGFAIGNVIAIDTGLKSTLYCGYAQYNEIHKTLLAYQKPLMKKSDGTDSLFIKADTFFSAPDPASGKRLTAQDSLIPVKLIVAK
jgi:lipopolysaccharide assembly outer membrane protein LptD (OstA)